MFPPVGERLFPDTVKAWEEIFCEMRRRVASTRQVTMTSSKVDQKHIRQYVALTRANFSDAELASYQEQGRAAIIADIPKMGILEKARQNAAKVLVPMLTELGYKEADITIAFRKQYEADDVLKLLKIDD